MAAGAFNLTAQINLQGPKNVGAVVTDIKKQLGSINANVNLTISSNAVKNVTQLTNGLQTLNQAFKNVQSSATSAASAVAQFNSAVGNMQIKAYQNNLTSATTASQKFSQTQSQTAQSLSASSSEMEEFGRQAGLAVRRFAAFTAVTSVIFGVTNSMSKGIGAFIEFDKELVKLQQVTGESAMGLSSLQNTITSLSTKLGTSSAELLNVSSTLAQAGLSARDTEKALKALALSSLAPSFDSMNETVEGSIALMRQFGIGAGDLTKALGSVNAVAAKFAVEASDIISAIQRTGGVFASASRGVSEGTSALNEFIAVFTSVRATTRESAETIATGLRTIFTRIQRGDTIDALKEYGVNLTDLDGKFVGAYKAVELLSRGLSSIDPRDLRFSKIVEELGGFRQIGKVIPLIQEFGTAQQALSVAQSGQNSLAADAVKAQLSLANQVSKVREEFLALFREIGSSDTFQYIVRGSLQVVSAIIKVADAVKGVLPVLAVLGISKGLDALTKFGSGLYTGVRKGPDNKQGGFADGGAVHRFASGGVVPGYGKGDKVRALLEPGEVVISNSAANKYGRGNLVRMNKYAGGNIVRDIGGVPATTSVIRDENNTKVGFDKDSYNINANKQIIKIAYNKKDKKFRANRKIIKTEDVNDLIYNNPKSFETWENIVSQVLGADRLNNKDPNYPIDLIKGKKLYDAKFRPDSKFKEKDAALKALSYRLDQTNSGFKYNKSGKTIRLTEFLGKETTTGKDDFQDPGSITFVYPEFKNIPTNLKAIEEGMAIRRKQAESLPDEGAGYFARQAVSVIGNSEHISGNKDIINLISMPKKYKSLGGLIQRFMAGGVADESTAMTLETARTKTRGEILSVLKKRPGGVAATERALGVGGGEIYRILGVKNPDPSTSSLQDAILKEFVKTSNRQSGAARGTTTKLQNQGLEFGAAGIFGSASPPANIDIVSDKLSRSAKVRVLSGVMDKNKAHQLDALLVQGTEDLAQKAASIVSGTLPTGKTISNPNAEASIQGGLLEKVVQLLGGPGKTQGQGMDFPNGLQGAAKYFGLPDDIPTDLKRTLSGPSTIKDNIITYLKNVMNYSSGGKIQKFVDGGVAQRKVGYIDYDVIANSDNEAIVKKGMEATGMSGPRLYTDYLTKLAVQARKEAGLEKLRAIYGVAGSGKTTLARGQGTDKAKLRQTERFPILSPEDIQKATEILILSSSVSKNKLDGIFSNTDRTYTLSSTTDEERSGVRDRKVSRDITGVGLENRKPGSTSSVSTDSAVGEALLADKLGKKSVVLGRSESGRLRRKSGDELVDVVKKKIGFTWGGFAPMTAGHESIMDAAAAMGYSPEDFIYLVGANEGIKPGDPSSYRTAVFDQDFRTILAKAGAGAKGAMVLPKPRDFEVPQAFDISSDKNARRKVLIPDKGSRAFVADKTPEQTAKYKDAGYAVSNIERSGGISGTMVRDLIMSGDLGKLQTVLSPGVYDIISNNIGRLQNRAKALPDIIEQVKKNQGSSIAEVEKEIKALGISRIDSKKVASDPEYAAKVEVLQELRSKRDKIKAAASFEPYKILEAMARKEPDRYGLDLSSIAPPAPPIRTVGNKQRASLGGIIKQFVKGGKTEKNNRLQNERIIVDDNKVMETRNAKIDMAKVKSNFSNMLSKDTLIQELGNFTSIIGVSDQALTSVLPKVIDFGFPQHSIMARYPGPSASFDKTGAGNFGAMEGAGSDGRGAISFRTDGINVMSLNNKTLYHELTHQLLHSLREKSASSFDVYKNIVSNLFDNDNNKVADAIDALPGNHYTSADIAYGRRYKISSMDDILRQGISGRSEDKLDKQQYGDMIDTKKKAEQAKIAKQFKPINLPVNNLLKLKKDQSYINRLEDMGKEEFLTTLVENIPSLDSHLSSILEDTLSQVMGAAGITRQKFAIGGKVDYYSLEKNSGLNSREFTDIAFFAKTNQLSLEEFKQYLAKRIQQKKSKSGLMMNPASLLRAITPEPPTASQKQMDLARSLMGPTDAQYNPKYDNARTFAAGGTVQAMVSNGEAFVPPETAKRIGYDKLNKMNQADKLGDLRSFSSGGISVFKGPGSGTSDSIGPIALPVGSFVIREAATKALGLYNGGSVGVQKFAGGSPGGVGTAPGDIIRMKEEREAKIAELGKVGEGGLRDQASKATGSARAILEAKIKQTEQAISGLDARIKTTTDEFGTLSTTIDRASQLQKSRQDKLNAAQAELVEKMEGAGAVFGGREFSALSDSEKEQAVTDARAGNIKDSSGAVLFARESTKIDREQQVLDRATRVKENAETTRSAKFGDAKSKQQVESRALTSTEIKNRNKADDSFFDYKARKEGKSEEAYKYGLAKQLGQEAYQTQQQYAGRKQEMVYELTGRQESISNIGSTIREAKAAASTATDPAAKAAAETRLADAESRLAMEAENMAKSMRDLNPTLDMNEVQTASKEIAELLSNGKLEEAQQKMTDALGKTPEAAEAMNIAMERKAKELGIDVEILKRRYGEGGSEAKTLQRQQFIASREGQRFGVAAEVAPDLAKWFSGTKMGKVGGNVSDFLTGQGGKYSQILGKFGGSAGLAAGISVIPGLAQTALGDPTSSQGAAQYAGAQGAASVAGAGLQLAASSGPLAPFVLAGTAAAALATAFKDGRNAFIEFEKNLRSKNIQTALEATASAFQDLARDAKDKVAQQKVSEQLVTAGQEADALTNIDTTAPKAFYTNMLLGDTGIGDKEATARSKILEKQGTMAYLSTTSIGTFFGGGNADENRRAYTRENIPEQAISNAKQYAEIASQTRQLLDVKGKSGQTTEDIKASPEYADLAKNLALSNAAIQEQILAIDNSTSYRTDADREAAKEAIIRAHADKEVSKIMSASDRAKASAELEKTSRSFSMSFKRLFDNMEASITRSNAELSKFNNALDASVSAMSGNSKNNSTQFDALDILKNPKGYSQDRVEAANNQTSKMFGFDASIVSGLSGLGEKLETSLIKSINSTLTKNTGASDTKVVMDLEKSIGDQVEGLGLPKDLSSQLSKEIASAVGDMRRDGTKKVDIDELMDKIPALKNSIESAKNAQNSSIAALQNWQNSLNTYSDAINKASDMEMQAADLRRKATDITIEGTMNLAQALGKDFGADIGTKLRDQKVSGMAGGLTDPNSIRNRMETLNNQRQRQQAEVDLSKQQSVGGSKNAIQDVINNEKALKQTNNQLRQTSAALKHLSESGSAASAALNAIQEAQRKQQGKVGLIEKLVTSGPEELFNFNKSLNSLNKMSAGQTVRQTPEERKDTLSTLNDIAPLLGSGQQANNIKANVLESMLRDSGIGVSTQFKEILNALRNPESDSETQQAIKVYQEAIQVQSQANEALAEINERLADDIANTTAEAIKKALSDITISFNDKQLDDIAKGIRAPSTVAEGKALGGLIYASAGTMIDFAPRGSDTVPAMLTPGEFVVNRTATANNLGLLHDINGGKTKYYADGGYVSNIYKWDFKPSRDATGDIVQTTAKTYPDISKIKTDDARPIESYGRMQILPDYSTESIINLERLSAAGISKVDDKHVGEKKRSDVGSQWFGYTEGLQEPFSRPASYMLGYNYPLSMTVEPSIGPTEQPGRIYSPDMPKKLTGEESLPFLNPDSIDIGNIKKTAKIEGNEKFNKYKKDLLKLKNFIPSDLDVRDESFTLNGTTITSINSARLFNSDKIPSIRVTKGGSRPLFLLDNMSSIIEENIGPFIKNQKTEGLDNLTNYVFSAAGLFGAQAKAKRTSTGRSRLASLDPKIIDPAKSKSDIEYLKELADVSNIIRTAISDIGGDNSSTDTAQTNEFNKTSAKLAQVYKRQIVSQPFKKEEYGLNIDPFTSTDSLSIYSASIESWKNQYQKNIEDQIRSDKALEKLEYYGKNNDYDNPVKITPEGGKEEEFPWIGGNFKFTDTVGAILQKEVDINQRRAEGEISTTPVAKHKLPPITTNKLELPYNISYSKMRDPNYKPPISPAREHIYVARALGDKGDLDIFRDLNSNLFLYEDETKRDPIDPIQKIVAQINSDKAIEDYFKVSKTDEETYKDAQDRLSTKQVTLTGNFLSSDRKSYIGATASANVQLPIGKYLIAAIDSIKDNKIKELKGDAKSKMKTKDAVELLTEKQYPGASLALILGAQELFSAGGSFELPELLGNGWFHPTLGSEYKSIYDVDVGTLRLYMTKLSQVFDHKASRLDQLMGRIPDNYRDKAVAGLTNLYGASKAFKAIGEGDTGSFAGIFGTDAFKNQTPGGDPQMNDKAKDLIQSLGMGVRLGGVGREGFTKDQMREREKQLEGVKLNTDEKGKSNQVKDISAETLPDTYMKLFDIAINPYNEFPKRDTRKDLIQEFISAVPTARDPSTNTLLFGPKTGAMFSDALTMLKNWYGGFKSSAPGIGGWLGTDFLTETGTADTTDPASKEPKSYQTKFDELKAAKDDALYQNAKAGFKHIGGKEKFNSELPDLDYYEKLQYRRTGGMIYAAQGQLVNFQPQGTDTVPAMLTPGEFVINARATAEHLPLLQAINNGDTKGFNRGGVVYLQRGGQAQQQKKEQIRENRQQRELVMAARREGFRTREKALKEGLSIGEANMMAQQSMINSYNASKESLAETTIDGVNYDPNLDGRITDAERTSADLSRSLKSLSIKDRRILGSISDPDKKEEKARELMSADMYALRERAITQMNDKRYQALQNKIKAGGQDELSPQDTAFLARHEAKTKETDARTKSALATIETMDKIKTSGSFYDQTSASVRKVLAAVLAGDTSRQKADDTKTTNDTTKPPVEEKTSVKTPTKAEVRANHLANIRAAREKASAERMSQAGYIGHYKNENNETIYIFPPDMTEEEKTKQRDRLEKEETKQQQKADQQRKDREYFQQIKKDAESSEAAKIERTDAERLMRRGEASSVEDAIDKVRTKRALENQRNRADMARNTAPVSFGTTLARSIVAGFGGLGQGAMNVGNTIGGTFRTIGGYAGGAALDVAHRVSTASHSDRSALAATRDIFYESGKQGLNQIPQGVKDTAIATAETAGALGESGLGVIRAGTGVGAALLARRLGISSVYEEAIKETERGFRNMQRGGAFIGQHIIDNTLGTNIYGESRKQADERIAEITQGRVDAAERLLPGYGGKIQTGIDLTTELAANAATDISGGKLLGSILGPAGFVKTGSEAIPLTQRLKEVASSAWKDADFSLFTPKGLRQAGSEIGTGVSSFVDDVSHINLTKAARTGQVSRTSTALPRTNAVVRGTTDKLKSGVEYVTEQGRGMYKAKEALEAGVPASRNITSKPIKLQGAATQETADRVRQAGESLKERLAQYTSSDDAAKRLRESNAFDVNSVSVDPDMIKKSSGQASGASGRFRASDMSIQLRSADVADDVIEHELGHSFQQNTGRLMDADKKVRTGARDLQAELGPDIKRFLEDSNGYSALAKSVKPKMTHFYTAKQIGKNPLELFTSLVQASGSQEFATNPQAIEMLKKLMKFHGFAKGGVVYANNGALIAAQQNTDTVPAMLTPGEFVVNRESAQRFMPTLNAINSGHFANGGRVQYLADGGVVQPKYLASGNMVDNIANMSSQSGVLNNAPTKTTMEKPAWVDEFVSRFEQSGAIFNQGASRVVEGASTISSAGKDIANAQPTLNLSGNVNLANADKIIQQSLAGMMPIAQSAGQMGREGARQDSKKQWQDRTGDA